MIFNGPIKVALSFMKRMIKERHLVHKWLRVNLGIKTLIGLTEGLVLCQHVQPELCSIQVYFLSFTQLLIIGLLL